MAQVEFAPAALQDLKDIKEHLKSKNCGSNFENKTLSKILSATERLETFPDLGPSLDSITKFASPYRYLALGDYIVVYKREGNKCIIVLVSSTKQDWIKSLIHFQKA